LGEAENNLANLGITLPESPAAVANYVPVVRTGNLIYLSGVGPAKKSDGSEFKGKLGSDLNVEEGYDAARHTAINIIARLKGYLGNLDRVDQIVKVLSMVNSDPNFVDPPAVTNGCSDLLVEVFGEKGKHARSAVGVATLPGGMPIEIEVIVQISD
jgi:enamine deaminase RidA (YjgF/YER057c/UK114 family)|tara:strand:- start:3016 stop:3483 length:468 start_codon:yes stop_codon:yes gene_type:complete